MPSTFTHTRLKYLGTLFVTLILGGGLYSYRHILRPDTTQTISPEIGSIEVAIYGIGALKSNQVFEYRRSVPGTVVGLPVKEGDKVQAGQQLLRFDEGPWVRAPFSGVVTSLPFHLQENIAPQVPVIRIEDLTQLEVEVTLEQQGAMQVRTGQPVRLSFENLRSEVFQGKVLSIYPANGQFKVRVTCDGLPTGLLPGMTADVSIEVAQKKGVTLVPVAALNHGKLTLLQDGKRRKVEVKAGVSDGRRIEVLSPQLNPSDLILLPKAK